MLLPHSTCAPAMPLSSPSSASLLPRAALPVSSEAAVARARIECPALSPSGPTCFLQPLELRSILREKGHVSGRLCKAKAGVEVPVVEASQGKRGGDGEAEGPLVVLTRERGKNEKMAQALCTRGIRLVELPMIEHVQGPDHLCLQALLGGTQGGAQGAAQAGKECGAVQLGPGDAAQWDWVAITSPEAASVFLAAWRAAGTPAVRVAGVGGATADALGGAALSESERALLRVAFVPSKATAKTLAQELPFCSFSQESGGQAGKEEGQGESRVGEEEGQGGKEESRVGAKPVQAQAEQRRVTVLYPASLKAGTDLESGLQARGFDVTRLNTYSTETVTTLDPDALALAASASVVTFASPSTVKAWVQLVVPLGWAGAAACIGETSAAAAKRAGITRVYHPASPGIEGWVESVEEALADTCVAALAQ